MPLDVLGRTRATLKHSTSPPRPTGLGNLLKLLRDGDRLLQLLIFNEEFLVSACHQRALITSLPFVHTARRSYRLNDPVRPPDCGNAAGSPAAMLWEAVQTLSFRGRRSRNKVSVGEPAEGSLPVFPPTHCAHRFATRGRVARLAARRVSTHDQGWSRRGGGGVGSLLLADHSLRLAAVVWHLV
jgi:hypothetical protein